MPRGADRPPLIGPRSYVMVEPVSHHATLTQASISVPRSKMYSLDGY
jgi:hypothetical protein